MSQFPSSDLPRPDRPRYSYSKLRTYTTCGYQFYLRYIEGAHAFGARALHVGTAVHEAIERDLKSVITGGGALEPDMLVAVAHDAARDDIERRGSEEIESGEVTKDALINEVGEQAAALVRVYASDVQGNLKPKAVEEPFLIDVNDKASGELAFQISGYVDLIEQDGAIVDFKTSGARMGDGTIEVKRGVREAVDGAVNDADASVQLTVYAGAQFTLNAELDNEAFLPVRLIGLIKTKSPYAQIIESVRSRHALRETADRFMPMHQGVQAGIFVPTVEPRTCSYCSFRNDCPFAPVAARRPMLTKVS